MPTLNEARNKILDLAKQFGWGISKDHLATKIFYAMIELGEAGDAWKHRGDREWLQRELNLATEQDLTRHVAEELIDAIFYCLNGLHCLDPQIDIDHEFNKKWEKNRQRGRTYIDDHE
jgi:NTP pyrophosphatase (non-canonical NTP hydrolase)